MRSLKRYSWAFVGGFLSTLIFHQGLVAFFHFLGIIPTAPFNMNPTQPWGVPAVLSLSFFGGLWGVFIWLLVAKNNRIKQITKCIIFGAVGPTAVAFFIVFPLKGIQVPLAFIPMGLLLNGAWGLGVWIFMALTQQTRHSYFTISSN